jgi:hypothetical protein
MHEHVESLREELRRIVAAERENLVLFLRRLDAFDGEQGWARIGFGSLWAYLLKELHLSESSAGRRLCALRLLRRFPSLEAPLSDGRLNLATLAVLGSVLTEANLDDLVRRASYLTKKEVEELVGTVEPREAPPTALRKLPTKPVAPAARAAIADAPVRTSAADVPMGVELEAGAPSEMPATMQLRAPPPPLPRVDPVASERWSLRITLDRARKEKLEALKALLSHEIADGDLERLFDRMLDDCLEKQRKQRRLATPTRTVKARPPRPPTPGTRAPIPTAVRREVLARDDHRCTSVAPDGRRCEETRRLELHHDPPAPVSGSSTAADLTTRCHAHNRLAAYDFYGRAYVERKIAAARRATEARGWSAGT